MIVFQQSVYGFNLVIMLLWERYSLQQGELTISEYYRILKSNGKDIDYLSEDTGESTCDQIIYWNKE